MIIKHLVDLKKVLLGWLKWLGRVNDIVIIKESSKTWWQVGVESTSLYNRPFQSFRSRSFSSPKPLLPAIAVPLSLSLPFIRHQIPFQSSYSNQHPWYRALGLVVSCAVVLCWQFPEGMWSLSSDIEAVPHDVSQISEPLNAPFNDIYSRIGGF